MNNKDKGLAFIGIGACLVVLALANLIQPSPARPTGRWSLIFGPLFDAFGPLGPALAFAGLGAGFALVGYILRGKK
ncbi:MAG: hypothetical protein Q8L49_01845 [Burkholderiaceae bacterium]|nr:hypothetical protein [Burkholderiaceae bacterium]